MNAFLITLIFATLAVNQEAMAQSRLLEDVKRNPDEAKSICQNLKELNKNDEVVDQVTSDKAEVGPIIDDLGRSYATGKRKDAVARVWLKKGAGVVLVNGKDMGIETKGK